LNDWIAKQKIAAATGETSRTPDPFKGQRDLSLRNDFNRQWPETAGIATLSQQMALMLRKGPQQIGWCSQ
jgi:hypothetical protein